MSIIPLDFPFILRGIYTLEEKVSGTSTESVSGEKLQGL